MNALVTIEFVVPVGYLSGDYARLVGNGGSGEIDWNSPLTEEVFDLFPNGAGIYGYGHAPWGHFRWGHAHSMRAAGYGHLPWGKFPWGYGTAVVKAKYEVSVCGDYKFGLACYDGIDNVHEGIPGEVTVNVHIAPASPVGLKKNSYNKATDILILDVAA